MSKVVDVHVTLLRRRGYQTLQDWLNADPNHVYVGRDMSFYVAGAAKSKWRNPFATKKYELKESLQLYTKHVVESELFEQLEELDGKTLGCWCVDDDNPVQTSECQCHAQVLCKLLASKKLGWRPSPAKG